MAFWNKKNASAKAKLDPNVHVDYQGKVDPFASPSQTYSANDPLANEVRTGGGPQGNRKPIPVVDDGPQPFAGRYDLGKDAKLANPSGPDLLNKVQSTNDPLNLPPAQTKTFPDGSSLSYRPGAGGYNGEPSWIKPVPGAGSVTQNGDLTGGAEPINFVNMPDGIGRGLYPGQSSGDRTGGGNSVSKAQTQGIQADAPVITPVSITPTGAPAWPEGDNRLNNSTSVSKSVKGNAGYWTDERMKGAKAFMPSPQNPTPPPSDKNTAPGFIPGQEFPGNPGTGVTLPKYNPANRGLPPTIFGQLEPPTGSKPYNPEGIAYIPGTRFVKAPDGTIWSSNGTEGGDGRWRQDILPGGDNTSRAPQDKVTDGSSGVVGYPPPGSESPGNPGTGVTLPKDQWKTPLPNKQPGHWGPYGDGSDVGKWIPDNPQTSSGNANDSDLTKNTSLPAPANSSPPDFAHYSRPALPAETRNRTAPFLSPNNGPSNLSPPSKNTDSANPSAQLNAENPDDNASLDDPTGTTGSDTTDEVVINNPVAQTVANFNKNSKPLDRFADNPAFDNTAVRGVKQPLPAGNTASRDDVTGGVVFDPNKDGWAWGPKKPGDTGTMPPSKVEPQGATGNLDGGLSDLTGKRGNSALGRTGDFDGGNDFFQGTTSGGDHTDL